MGLSAGTRLGSYDILSLLGAGGMGMVYEARDTKLGRVVAIKVLREEVAQDRERLKRFEREAQLLAALNHPHIATLYGMEEADGVKFLVMEFVPGPTLADRLNTSALPLEEALPLSRQIAEALEAAHEKGIIHRDLKPANIKITPRGNVKLLDFGLAKAVAVAHGPSAETGLESTREGTILGTPAYMSPEQVRGQAVDRRADIWAFGCVLFEALAGRRAFSGDTAPDIFSAILERAPDWNALPADTPLTIHSLLQRCLRKDLSRRLRDIGDARIDILEAGEPLSRSLRDKAPRAQSERPETPVPLSLPETVSTTSMAMAETMLSPEVAQIHKGLFVSRLANLRRLQKRTWPVRGFGFVLALVVAAWLSVSVQDFMYYSFSGPVGQPTWHHLVGPPTFVVVTFGATLGVALWWRRLIARDIESIRKDHAREMQSCGGDAMLRDPVALEKLLHTLKNPTPSASDMGAGSIQAVEESHPRRPEPGSVPGHSNAIIAPQHLTPAVALADSNPALEREQMQSHLFQNRLERLDRLYKRAWWLAPALFALGISLLFGFIVFALGYQRTLNPLEPQAGAVERADGAFLTQQPFLLGLSIFLCTGLITFLLVLIPSLFWQNHIIRNQIKSISKNHPQEVQSWGGEAILRDPLAVESLLRAVRK